MFFFGNNKYSVGGHSVILSHTLKIIGFDRDMLVILVGGHRVIL